MIVVRLGGRGFREDGGDLVGGEGEAGAGSGEGQQRTAGGLYGYLVRYRSRNRQIDINMLAIIESSGNVNCERSIRAI